MDIDFKRVFLPLMAGLALAFASSTQGAPGKSKAGGWEPSADHVEDVVISVKTDPLEDPEAACVAIQIGINLLSDDLNGDDPGGQVTPADDVTLFLTLGGVNVLSPRVMTPEPQEAGPLCFSFDKNGIPITPPLSALIDRFWLEGGNIMVCPLCWFSRYPDELPVPPPSSDVAPAELIGNGAGIHDLFLKADKVIDF
jgi:hypothetical protein